jgi:hypothetical protein
LYSVCEAGQAVTTLREAYYADDGLVFDAVELDNITAWTNPRLYVDQVSGRFNNNNNGQVMSVDNSVAATVATGNTTAVTVGSLQDECDHWILDICLDYFSTYNPFRTRLQKLIERDLSSNNDDDDIVSERERGKPSVDVIMDCALDLWRLLRVRSPEYLRSTAITALEIRQLHSRSLHALRSLLCLESPHSSDQETNSSTSTATITATTVASTSSPSGEAVIPFKRFRHDLPVITRSMDVQLVAFFEAVPELYSSENWEKVKLAATALTTSSLSVDSLR